MKIQSVFDKSFATYGRVIEGYDFAPLLAKLRESTEQPAGRVVYVPSDAGLESLPAFAEVRDGFYGGMPIQFGYCNGSCHSLNCLEYHRDSELDIAADDVILLVASQQKIEAGRLDTAEVEAFAAPAGTAVELYATTLHYAPINAARADGFRVVIVLPRGTNTEKPAAGRRNDEDMLLFARNKWLIAHPEAPEAKEGAFVGLTGPNIKI